MIEFPIEAIRAHVSDVSDRVCRVFQAYKESIVSRSKKRGLEALKAIQFDQQTATKTLALVKKLEELDNTDLDAKNKLFSWTERKCRHDGFYAIAWHVALTLVLFYPLVNYEDTVHEKRVKKAYEIRPELIQLIIDVSEGNDPFIRNKSKVEDIVSVLDFMVLYYIPHHLRFYEFSFPYLDED